jgi:hypothetical protein
MMAPTRRRLLLRSTFVVAGLLLAGSAGHSRAQTPPPGPEPTGSSSPAAAIPSPTAGPPLGQPVRPAAGVPLANMLPNGELVYGYALKGFDTVAYVKAAGGYLASYQELVDGVSLSGAEVVQRVAEAYSVSPRVLLALIEMASGWVTDPNPMERGFPAGEPLPGLYVGLSAAADGLNRLYYGHKDEGQRAFPIAGGGQILLDDTNSATFAVVGYVSRNVTLADWSGLEQPSRYSLVYAQLFGDPFANAAEAGDAPVAALPQVELMLPFAGGEIWFFVRGPHSGWGVGGPRAAVDFAPPPEEQTGCTPSGAWVTAAATGRVLQSQATGLVLEIPDRNYPLDGFAGTGWVHVYTHLAAADRPTVGTLVRVGERLGHPSCEASLLPLARVSVSRRFHGEWIAVDDPRAPLVFDHWAALPGPEAGSGWLAHTGVAPRPAGLTKDLAVNSVSALPQP